MTLLEKAKKIHANKKLTAVTSEQVELAIAWLKSEISYTQVSIAIEQKAGQQPYSFVANALKRAYEDGKLKIP